MASPKTAGPDPYRLLQKADEALTRCELRLPGSVSPENLREARVAVSHATPQVERHTAAALEARLADIEQATEASPLMASSSWRRFTISRESRKAGLTDRIEGSPFADGESVEVMEVAEHEAALRAEREKRSRLEEDMAENCVSKTEATTRLSEAVEVARGIEQLKLARFLQGEVAKAVIADALLAGRPNNRDRDGKFGEGAILSNRSTAETGAERVVESLALAFQAEEGEMPESLRDLKFGPRTYTPEQAEAIRAAVAGRIDPVEVKAEELCKAVDGDDWEDATDLQKSVYRRRAAAIVGALELSDEEEESEGERHDREVAEAEEMVDWRCECGDLNRGHEAFCFRCGAGKPESREEMEANVVLAHEKNPSRLRVAMGGE